MINSKYMLDKSFQEILYRIDNWVNEGSGWITESINGEYANISMYRPLVGSTFIELPDKSKNFKKGLINIKNNGNKCVFWCHIKHLNLMSKSPQRIRNEDKKLVSSLNYEGIKFPVSRKNYGKIEKQSNICINVFCYENRLTYPIYVLDKTFSEYMDLLLIFDENKSHYVYIKDFNKFMFSKTKNKNKKYFCKCCLHCFSSGKVLMEHTENCLIINGKQNVKFGKG